LTLLQKNAAGGGAGVQDSILKPVGHRAHPFRTAVLRGLGVVLPPLLTIVILVWVARTMATYVLAPVTLGVRNVVAWSLSDIETDPAAMQPTDRPNVFSRDGRLYRRLPNGDFVPLEVYQRVLRASGPTDIPITGQDTYRRYVEIRYLRPVITVPVFIVVFILAMYVLGSVFAAGLGGLLWNLLEYIISRVPVVRGVYGAVKQVTDYMLTEKEMEFTRVVAVEYPRKGVWSLAFVTGEGMGQVHRLAGEPVLSVLVPTSPMPVTGYSMMVPKSEVLDLNMTVDEALQFILSCGVVVPPQQLRSVAGPSSA
jgi:uncharacterized membrane protein